MAGDASCREDARREISNLKTANALVSQHSTLLASADEAVE
jgi:hypothetical protein